MPRLCEQVIDLEVRRAINGARYAFTRRGGGSRDGRAPYGFRTFAYSQRLKVTEVRPNRPYVTGSGSNGRSPKYSHVAKWGWLAWRDGVPVGMTVRYACGGHTASPELTTEPALPVCPKCQIALIGYDVAAQRLAQS